jgi:hypothetical protein
LPPIPSNCKPLHAFANPRSGLKSTDPNYIGNSNNIQYALGCEVRLIGEQRGLGNNIVT